jgi:glycosyltransferase involved in cell wall biosynthesis
MELGISEARLRKLYSQATADLDFVVAPSRFEADRTVKELNVDRRKVVVVYNGIDLKETRKLSTIGEAENRHFLSKYSLRKNNYVLYLGRLDADKGIHILPFLAKMIPHTQIVIAGRQMYDYPCGEMIFKRIIEYYGVSQAISLLGFVNDREKFLLMKNAMALIYPSTEVESFGLVPVECLSVGTPVILPRLGPFPEIKEKIGKPVYLYDPFNIAELVDAIERVKRDFRDKRFSDQWNMLIKRYFSSEAMAQGVLRYLTKAQRRELLTV